jgi:hypothetical protein
MITLQEIKEGAANCLQSQKDFEKALWFFLCTQKRNRIHLAKELKIKGNVGDIFAAIMQELVGHISSQYA